MSLIITLFGCAIICLGKGLEKMAGCIVGLMTVLAGCIVGTVSLTLWVEDRGLSSLLDHLVP